MSNPQTVTTIAEDLLSTLPGAVTAFARELAVLFARHQLSEFSGTYELGWKSNAWGKMQFSWRSGRYGDESHLIALHLEKHVTLNLEAKP